MKVTSAPCCFVIVILAILAPLTPVTGQTTAEIQNLELSQALVKESPWIGEWSIPERPEKYGDIKFQFQMENGMLTIRTWKNRDEVFGKPKQVTIRDGTIEFTFRGKRVKAVFHLIGDVLSGTFDGEWNYGTKHTERTGELSPQSGKPSE